MTPTTHPFIVSDGLEVQQTANEDERRELMLSDRKASKLLGVTILRAPRPTIDQKASKILGTNVVRSGIDWETRMNGGFVSPRKSRLRDKFLMAKVTPLILGERAERARAFGREGQRIVLSPRWKSTWTLRRRTISYESGLNLSLSEPSSPMSIAMTVSSTTSTFEELLPEDRGEGSDSDLEFDVGLEDTTESETGTLVDLGIVPPPVPPSCPPSPIEPVPCGVPISPAARRNPVLQRRREMVRSMNKSVQMLGSEARRAILEKMERENAGRIGWSGV
jgi:hypothetical protein